MTEASELASTSALKLPSRKTYITVLSSVAFVTGITVATVVTVRRGRRMRLEELREGAQNIQYNSGQLSTNSSRNIQGPVSLSKEMNRAAFGKKTSQGDQSSESPPVLLRQRGKQVKTSVFDSNVNAAAPSVLMKGASRSNATKEESIPKKLQSSSPTQSISFDHDKLPEQEESLMESPVLLAVKAIGIATALVGTGALVTWEIARRALGVQNVDELIDRLAVIVPSKAKDRDALSDVGQAARKSLKSRIDDQEWEEEMSRQTTTTRKSPMSTDEALEALDAAAQKGEVATWVTLLSNQLDAEREQDLEQRRQRIARQRRGVLQEQLST